MQKVEITLVDDTDGSEAAETVPFELDGHAYEIDLSAANAERLRKSLLPVMEAARPMRGPLKKQGKARIRNRQIAVTPPSPVQRPAIPVQREGSHRKGRAERARIREWGLANGHQVGGRGRIPDAVVTAYRQAHPAG